MFKSFILITQSAILLTLLLKCYHYNSDVQELEKQLIRIDVMQYYIADTSVRVCHYVIPHTKFTLYCPECGLLQKPNTMELKE